MRRLIYTHRRVSFQQSPRDSARVSRGLEPVCNKINRGVARERTRGAGMGGWSGGGRKDREREWGRGLDRASTGVVFQRKRVKAELDGGGPGEGRQNHPAGYSHPLDEATDCDGVPPPPLFSSSTYGATPPPVSLKLRGCLPLGVVGAATVLVAVSRRTRQVGTHIPGILFPRGLEDAPACNPTRIIRFERRIAQALGWETVGNSAGFDSIFHQGETGHTRLGGMIIRFPRCDTFLCRF